MFSRRDRLLAALITLLWGGVVYHLVTQALAGP
jgi:hypothetical protein